MIRKCLCLKLHHVSKGSSKKKKKKKKPFNVSHKVKFSFEKIFSSGGNSENIINISFYN